jgi:CRP/FNR family transcriptional regulator
MPKANELELFRDLTDEEAGEVEPYLETETFSKKNTIFSEGDPSDWFCFVLSGEVKITKLSQEGKEIILELIHPTNFFGGLAVMRGFPYPANAVAKEDSRIVKISRTNLMTVLDRFPGIMLNIVQQMGDRVKDTHETMKNIALEKVGSRIASLLLKLSEQAGRTTAEGTEITLKLTKQDIAEMVGTTVETSIRTMSQFKRAGLIEERSGRIIIRNPSGLETLST